MLYRETIYGNMLEKYIYIYILLAANQSCKNLFPSAWGRPQARSMVTRKQKNVEFWKEIIL